MAEANDETLRTQAGLEGIQDYAVGAIVKRSGKVLMLQRKADDFLPDVYEIPGGGVEPGEDFASAVSRELIEETGLQIVEVIRYVGYFDYVGGRGKLVRQFNFDIAAGGKVMVHPEHQAVAWVDEETITAYPMSSEMARTVHSAFGRY